MNTTTRRRFIECESALSGPLTASHLRTYTPGAPLFTSGSSKPLHTLCGRDLTPGSWDIARILELADVDTLASIPPGTPGNLCRACHAAAHKEGRQ